MTRRRKRKQNVNQQIHLLRSKLLSINICWFSTAIKWNKTNKCTIIWHSANKYWWMNKMKNKNDKAEEERKKNSLICTICNCDLLWKILITNTRHSKSTVHRMVLVVWNFTYMCLNQRQHTSYCIRLCYMWDELIFNRFILFSYVDHWQLQFLLQFGCGFKLTM